MRTSELLARWRMGRRDLSARSSWSRLGQRSQNNVSSDVCSYRTIHVEPPSVVIRGRSGPSDSLTVTTFLDQMRVPGDLCVRMHRCACRMQHAEGCRNTLLETSPEMIRSPEQVILVEAPFDHFALRISKQIAIVPSQRRVHAISQRGCAVGGDSRDLLPIIPLSTNGT